MDVETLYQTWHENLERYFTTCVGADDAQDLTHDLFLRLLDNLDREITIDDPKHWLWKSARNLMIDQHRYAHVRSAMAPLEDAERLPARDDAMASLLADMDSTLSTQEAMRCLESLPSPQQQVIVLRFWNDWRYRQVADALGISDGAARARGMRGLRRLEAVLTR